MRRFVTIMLAMVGLLGLALAGVLAQAGGGAGERARGSARLDPAAFEQERVSAALTRAGLIGAERAAAEAALKAKQEARRQLMSALEELRSVAEDPKASEAKLKEAIAAYQQQLAKYRATVEAEDKALVAKLSVRSHARCLAVGILDNGIGLSGRPARPLAGGPPAPPR